MTELKTKNGIMILAIAMLASITLSILNYIIFIAFVDHIFDFSRDGGITTYMIMAGILSFLGWGIFALRIVGYVFLYLGRDDFGERHWNRLKVGLILVAVGFISGFLPFIGSLAGVVSGLGIVFLIMEICHPQDRLFLWIGFGFKVAYSIISTILYILFFVSMSIGAFTGIFLLILIVGSIGETLILVAYYRTYKGINRGKISPDGLEEPEDSLIPTPASRASQDRRPGRSMIKEEVASVFSRFFDISPFHGELLQKAGYIKLEDFEYATIEEILFVDGINPTCARKIVDRMEIRGKDRAHRIEVLTEELDIPGFFTRSLYDAGYSSIDKLHSATIHDLMMVKGVNPTVARKIFTIMQGLKK